MQKDEIPLVTLLKSFGCVTNSQLATIFEKAQLDTEILYRVLLVSGVLDAQCIGQVEECRMLVHRGDVTLEQSKQIFELAISKSLNIANAHHLWRESQLNIPLTIIPIESGTEFSEVFWQSSWQTAMDYVQKRDYKTGRRILESLKELVCDRDTTKLIDCLDAIAETYITEQDYCAAEQYCSLALESRLQKFALDSIDCADGMNNLAKVYYLQGRFNEAEKYVKEYMSICSKKLGSNHTNIICGWQNIATLYQAQQKYNYSEHAYKLAIKGCLETIGDTHPRTIKLKRSYATLLLQMNRVGESQKIAPSANAVASGTWRTFEAEQETFNPADRLT